MGRVREPSRKNVSMVGVDGASGGFWNAGGRGRARGREFAGGGSGCSVVGHGKRKFYSKAYGGSVL